MTNPTAPQEPLRDFLQGLCRAEDSLSRLETRLATSPLADGWTARTAFVEAASWSWNTGVLVHLEDLVLHDAALDPGLPDPDVIAAHRALRRRRRAAGMSSTSLRDWREVRDLLGVRQGADERFDAVTQAALTALAPRPQRTRDGWEAPLEASPSPPLSFLEAMTIPKDFTLDQDDEVYAYWASPRPLLREWTPLVAAIVGLDLWAQLQPLHRATDLGPLVVEADLRGAKRIHRALLLVETGRRALSRRNRIWTQTADPLQRAVFWLDAIQEGLRSGKEALDAMSIARVRLDRHLIGRRRSSRLPALCELFLRFPVVTVAQAAKALRVSPQAVRVMIDELSPALRETTGRQSYRAWRI